MKKIFVLFLLVYSVPATAIIVTDFSNTCGADDYDKLYASFTPISFNCSAGQYLPADGLGCVTCPNGATCVGGTYIYNEIIPQGVQITAPITQNQNSLCSESYNRMAAVFTPNQYTCNVGYYLPADGIECIICPQNSICSGGTYTFNETTDQGIVACASGTFAPTGSSICYPHILHVGDSNVYLKSTKQTTPSLNLRIGDDVFYANMTTVRTRMNKDSSHYLHVKTADNIHYYVCDDTTCPQ